MMLYNVIQSIIQYHIILYHDYYIILYQALQGVLRERRHLLKAQWDERAFGDEAVRKEYWQELKETTTTTTNNDNDTNHDNSNDDNNNNTVMIIVLLLLLIINENQ